MPGPGTRGQPKIRQHPEISHIGIVLMTAYELPELMKIAIFRHLVRSAAFKPLPPMEDYWFCHQSP